MTINPHTQVSEKAETLYLWWLDKKSKTRQQAGVAFYEDQYGEYRLKIDFITALMDRPSYIFLRPVSARGDRVSYCAEAVVKMNKTKATRKVLGEGYSSNETDGEIYVDLGPFEKTLVVTLK